MKQTIVSYTRGFNILLGDHHSQAGTLVIGPGKSVGGAENRHGGADQWIYVASGTGVADIAGQRVNLAPASLILIQRGDPHAFRNTGSADLCLLTFYTPPAYDDQKNELPAGRP